MINRIIDAISMALNDEFNPNNKNNYKIDIIVADTFDQVLEELQKH